MVKKPLVSVIIPAYNCERYIKKAIDSILNQSYDNIEILISDDGSKDRTKSIIDNFDDSRVKCYHNDVNLGNILTRNKLFALANGDYITIQDADDWAHSERIQLQLDAFKRFPEIGGCGTNYYRVRSSGVMELNKKDSYDTMENIPGNISFCPASIMIKRRVYNQIGGLNPYFERLFGEDKYWIALIQEKFKVLFISKPLYFYSWNPESLTKYFDHPRKLLVLSVIDELLRQRAHKGTDWLELNQEGKIKEFEEKLMGNKKYIGEQYRAFAAISIDSKRYNSAFSLLVRSFILKPFGPLQFKTLSYFFRSLLKGLKNK